MSRYVFGKVLWDPKLDAEKEIDSFMKLYYGPAAPYMREFFNLIHKEVKDRKFVQHTEDVKRGFVTKELASKAYDIFSKAEKAVNAEPKYLDRVLLEKVFLLFADLSDRCRTNGKISEGELQEYASKLAEFAGLGRKFGISYFARNRTPVEWFWDTALLKLAGKTAWYKDPKIEALIKTPLETIGETVPRCQSKINGGWQIPIEGVGGGVSLDSYSYNCPLKKNVKLLRRPSSGYGYMMTNLYLDENPRGAVKFELEGMDNGKEGKSLMEITVNGTTVFKGESPFAKNEWKYASLNIPEGVLKKGKNLIEFKNITPDEVSEEEKKHVEFIVGKKKNYYWGWFIISNMKFMLD